MKIFETQKDTDERIAEVSVNDRLYPEGTFISTTVVVDTSKKFQTFKGFGGAVTESAGYVLSKLDEKDRNKVMESYYSKENGNGYIFARTHLNSCDFSLENWNCLTEKADNLDGFDMSRPDMYITPLLKKVVEISKDEYTCIVTPWSPSPWMKENNDMNHGGKVLPEYRQLWAQCYARYIKELADRGIKVSYVSVQNEPAAVQTWDSCEYSGEEEAQFAVDYLRPELDKAGLGNVKILIWDHNRDIMKERIDASMSVNGAEKAIDGAAFHWYSGDQYENVKYFADKYPQKDLFFTEGCIEGGPRNGKWFPGERYAHNIINDLNAGCTAWIDWNLALDMQGGPNHVKNYCDAPVLVDTEKKEIHVQSSFYYIGHFSRFIKPGAVRVHTEASSWMLPTTIDGRLGRSVECTAFVNPDKSLVMVLTNLNEDIVTFELIVDGKKQKMYIPPRSIQTYVM